MVEEKLRSEKLIQAQQDKMEENWHHIPITIDWDEACNDGRQITNIICITTLLKTIRY